MPADKAALGMLPTSGFQYCEALRVASALGWYVFPPKTISLMFDGREVFIADSGQWRTFTHETLEQEFLESWDRAAPAMLRGHAPSYIRKFSEPGVVQIWSGFFVETAPGWSIHIRPLANVHNVSAYACYEAIVETDHFCPMPLFVNLRLVRTDSEILIESDMPLFQVNAFHRASLLAQEAEIRTLERNDFDWEGVMKTVRIKGVTQPRAAVGSYGAGIRRRTKRDHAGSQTIEH